jgi:hypothetical protein
LRVGGETGGGLFEWIVEVFVFLEPSLPSLLPEAVLEKVVTSIMMVDVVMSSLSLITIPWVGHSVVNAYGLPLKTGIPALMDQTWLNSYCRSRLDRYN